MSTATKIGIIAVALASAGVAAFAANTMENDAAALANAKISLSQAIASAEQHTGGKAVHAEFEHTRAGWAYEVETVNGAKVVDVTVDAATGTVVAAVDDKMDRNEKKEDREEHDERD